MLISLLLIWLASPSLSFSQNNQTVRLEIHGVDQSLEQQVLAYVDQDPVLSVDEIPDYLDKLKSNVARSLQAIGYYQSEVIAKHATYKNSTAIALHIKPGTPVRLRTIDINVKSDDEELHEFNQELGALGLAEGDAFNHGVYEQAKETLIRTAQLLGYFDAEFTRSQVLITKSDNSADVFIDYDLGNRYSINRVEYKQNLYDQKFLQRWQKFGEAGVPYHANHVRDLTVSLQNSGYFKRVRVIPDTLLASNHQLPLIVDLEPAEENSVGIGIGFATDTGTRLKSNWLRPHTNRHGHAFESNASISKIRQDLSASYRIPHSKNPDTNSYSLDVGLQNQTTGDTFSQLRTLEFTDHRLTKSKWRRDLFIRIENERFDIGDTKSRINLVLPGIEFSRVESTGGIHPNKGRYFSFQLMAAQRKLFSDNNMFRATAATKFLTSWNTKHYLIARAELGALHTDSFIRVPTTHRFFAGGDNSIRGYSYRQISPKNSNGESIGGQFLTTGSIEYNRYVNERFAIAAFADVGRAFNDSSDPTQIGLGLGLRWRSPVGSLRIDIAHGLDNDTSPYRLHLAIGPEL